MTEIIERRITTNGVDLHVVEAGARSTRRARPRLPRAGVLVAPPAAAPLAAAGYRVIAPDQRGYGRSSRPEPVEDYDILHLTGDLIGTARRARRGARAVFVGHDWGSMVVSSLALLAPERVAGFVNMSVPFLPACTDASRADDAGMRSATRSSTSCTSRSSGVADADLGADPARTMRRLLAQPVDGRERRARPRQRSPTTAAGSSTGCPKPDGLPDWLSRRPSSTTTSRSSPVRASPVESTGTATWTATGQLTEHVAGADVERAVALHRRQPSIRCSG